jgi:hypothetical protein
LKVVIDKSSAIASPAGIRLGKKVCMVTALAIFFSCPFSLAVVTESFVAGLFFFLRALITMESLLCILLKWGNEPQYGDVVSLASYAESPLVQIPEACRHDHEPASLYSPGSSHIHSIIYGWLEQNDDKHIVMALSIVEPNKNNTASTKSAQNKTQTGLSMQPERRLAKKVMTREDQGKMEIGSRKKEKNSTQSPKALCIV